MDHLQQAQVGLLAIMDMLDDNVFASFSFSDGVTCGHYRITRQWARFMLWSRE